MKRRNTFKRRKQFKRGGTSSPQKSPKKTLRNRIITAVKKRFSRKNKSPLNVEEQHKTKLQQFLEPYNFFDNGQNYVAYIPVGGFIITYNENEILTIAKGRKERDAISIIKPIYHYDDDEGIFAKNLPLTQPEFNDALRRL